MENINETLILGKSLTRDIEKDDNADRTTKKRDGCHRLRYLTYVEKIDFEDIYPKHSRIFG